MQEKALRRLTIQGLRGFATEQKLDFALPNGNSGSGLTMLVGPNNSGKTTIVEGIRAFSSQDPQSFTEGQRNPRAGDRISLKLKLTDNTEVELRTIPTGGSETEWIPSSMSLHSKILALPSRRYFPPYFGKASFARTQYSTSIASVTNRGGRLNSFTYRLFEIQKHRENFDNVLGKVLSPLPKWKIDQSANGEYYLKFELQDLHHSSEGLGEGFVSLFFVVDALYDSKEGDVIVIDEPELSLHPALQRRLSDLFIEYAATRQIVLSTHSPYFVDVSPIAKGARVARVHLGSNGCTISELSQNTGLNFQKLQTDLHNPHVFGLDGREVLFLEEGVILVEGQEDAINYPRIAEQLDIELPGTIFGWGVGGADKMKIVAQILIELGFKRVVGILDGNRSELKPELDEQFPDYSFFVIPSEDVRTKAAQSAKPSVEGLLKNGKLQSKFVEPIRALFHDINKALASAD